VVCSDRLFGHYCDPVLELTRQVSGHQPERSPTEFVGWVGISICRDREGEERMSGLKINRWLTLVRTKR